MVSGNVFGTEPSGRIIQFAEGTYAIETNGVMTLAFADGGEEQMQLSADGEFLVFGGGWGTGSGGDFIAEREMGIGIRRDPPPSIPAPVVFNNDMAMTPTGLVMTATMPTDYSVEGISTDNLVEGKWSSGGIFSTETGTVEIHDPEATNDTVRFYSATFVPW